MTTQLEQAARQALEALEKVTKEMLALKDALAERGARPTTNVFHQRLWDSSFKAYTDYALPAATTIKEALAQPEQEPVAWLHTKIDGVAVPHRPADLDKHPDRWEALYKTPPQPEPVIDKSAAVRIATSLGWEPKRKPLTDEQIEDEWERLTGHSIFGGDRAEGRAMYLSPDEVTEFARAIEAAHGIKE